MRDGDRSGLALLRDSSAWIGLKRDNGTTRVVMVNGITMDGEWKTSSTGAEAAGASVTGSRIWLRATADIRPGSGRQGRFSYSTDGVTFAPLGPALTLKNEWQFFMGYRFGIFNYATVALGGSVRVERFELTPGSGSATTSAVSLRARANDRYVCADNAGGSPLIANRTSVGVWETFDLVDLGNGDVALRARANDRFVCADNAGASPLIANRTSAGNWETFRRVNNADGTVSLRARANDRYVSAADGGASPLIANRTSIGPWESFTLTPA